MLQNHKMYQELTKSIFLNGTVKVWPCNQMMCSVSNLTKQTACLQSSAVCEFCLCGTWRMRLLYGYHRCNLKTMLNVKLKTDSVYYILHVHIIITTPPPALLVMIISSVIIMIITNNVVIIFFLYSSRLSFKNTIISQRIKNPKWWWSIHSW